MRDLFTGRCNLKKRIFIFIATSLLSSCYVTQQGWYQAQLLMAAEPISTVLQRPQLALQTKQKLEFIGVVLEAAHQEGLSVGQAYRGYVDTGQPVASWLVFAAHPDRLQSVTWWFPIVGSVPYVGYFDEKDRDRFASELIADGFDVYKSSASAFSSLGWIDEPIFSSMLERRRWALAQLLFHELTHRTLWVPGGVRFNESLASYVAKHLTEKWLIKWQMHDELQDYGLHQEDRRRYKMWARDFRETLHSLYETQKVFDAQKKAKVFQKWISDKKPKFKKYDFVGVKSWNNARLQAVSLYESYDAEFLKAHRCFGLERPLSDFLNKISDAYTLSSDAQKALASVCD
ncbi:MAG: aminopeptidase [Oligoflexales bacterium]